jgi:hypothetical protein
MSRINKWAAIPHMEILAVLLLLRDAKISQRTPVKY